MASYYISSVYKDNQGRITDVIVHLRNINNSTFDKGQKVSEATVINAIDARQHDFMTIRWDYAGATWRRGAIVTVSHNGQRKYIRTVPDAQIADNLDNMLTGQTFI
jgi:hypothetical protein